MDRQELEKLIQNLYVQTGAGEFFEPPTIHVASAFDPFFARYKTVIGPHHWTPQEALGRKFPEATARSVVVWVLPVSRKARETNRRETERPSVEWAAVRSFGEIMNEEIRSQTAGLLTAAGFPAVAPHLEQREIYPAPGWDVKNFTSSWSERHVAFVAGAGTFGLSAGLITAHGVAMRLGSVVTALELAPDARPYGDDPFAWCTRCGACIRRCPGHAIGREFTDRDKPGCANYCVTHVNPGREEHYGWLNRALGCALCQTAVPCEFQRPGVRDLQPSPAQ